ncbi:3-deoxy-D-arabinoheptulosonate-7-phosphate synthase [Alkalibaculum bacchi]|uniref:3-deoxy-D-arabinoheptulosonate-7-phosphate synthase n=1 Tax=Alkalibaculum bacchi TaxID=645887 RepID=A0A366I8W0_9FIRM|nr:3-deoxy-7-phosphoheptulonate synthase [Alkalibaculum bacchi]RBP64405.1 3-deoxy-D-arabinoheptulosonate-7-phosphate synthase [Alkalibaculum bacchi]
MIIVLKNGTSMEEVAKITNMLEKFDVKVNPIVGESTTILGLVGDTSSLDIGSLYFNENVEKIMKVQEPYKKSNRKMHPQDTVININGVEIGGKRLTIMAGPCSVEGEEQIVGIAKYVKEQGARILRGGAWKPRTSPYAFQGLKADGLKLLNKAKTQTQMPIISEITNPAHIEMFMDMVDIFQVGARNMQNFEILKELGKTNKPVLIKRGFANTYEELLMSAEYVMSGGNEEVILCERGIRTSENYTRNTLDISAIPALKKLSHLPVIVDPSHAAGLHWMVEPLSMAAIAAGADGLILEVHNDPKNALCDGAQSLTYKSFKRTMEKLRLIANAVDREI